MAETTVEGGSEPNPLDILALARVAARRKGYALTVHGSLSRDVDLVAVPWREDAAEPAEVVEAIRKAIGGWIFVAESSEREGYMTIDDASKHSPVERPHGRLAWSIYGVLGGSYIDLSVMPLRAAAPIDGIGLQGRQMRDTAAALEPCVWCDQAVCDPGCVVESYKQKR